MQRVGGLGTDFLFSQQRETREAQGWWKPLQTSREQSLIVCWAPGALFRPGAIPLEAGLELELMHLALSTSLPQLGKFIA